MQANTTKMRLRAALGVNIAVVLMEMVALVFSAAEHGLGMLRFYTELSNILALAACAVMAFYTAGKLSRGTEIPTWTRLLKYAAACCLTLTFLVVISVLAPTEPDGWRYGYWLLLLHNQSIFLHLLCPLATALSYILWEGTPLPTVRQTLWPLLPTVLYALIALILNVLRLLNGPYPFLHVYEQPVYMSVLWVIVLLGADYGVIRLLRWLAGRTAN